MGNNSDLSIKHAIRRHDIDADWFQKQYENASWESPFNIFLYGRHFVIRELERVLSELPRGAKILDVGSGTGHLTNWMRSKGFDVYGIEPANNMLTRARHNFPGIEFKEGISSNIPYPDASFDAIVSFEVLRYLSEDVNLASYREFYRVLKPGGRLFVTQVNRFATDAYIGFYYLKKFVSYLRRIPYHHVHFTTPAGEETLLKDIGFTHAHAYGVLKASLRIANLIQPKLANFYRKLLEKHAGEQVFHNEPRRSMAGHLIVDVRK